MRISALLTSAGINIGVCALFFSLYSILRKQPSNVIVYFGRRLSEERKKHSDSFSLHRLVPDAGWLVKAWVTTEDEILTVAGLDAVVFIRLLVFSFRIFSIAALVCIFAVLPMNYFGKDMRHKLIHSEPFEVFTITNVHAGSRGLWVHCGALYIISLSACLLLYFEYKEIVRIRVAFITTSPPNPGHFSVLVRAIPRSPDELFDDAIMKFFTKYHGSSYLSHQLIYKTGAVQKIVNTATKVYKKFAQSKVTGPEVKHQTSRFNRCGLCGGKSHSFHLYQNALEFDTKQDGHKRRKESSAAFVFFKTRYAALVASEILQTSDPMSWVIDLAPQPKDVYWCNLWVPYKILWLRRIAVLIATIAFMILFLAPVTLVQGMTEPNKLQRWFPFLQGILQMKVVSQVVTGYLPSVILTLALYTVAPTMMLFADLEGVTSQSGKRRSACRKVLYFYIFNIFFVNVFSGPFIGKLSSRPKDIPILLAKAVPAQATFFITYVLTSGWASLSAQLLQPVPLICNFLKRMFCSGWSESDYVPSFPYYIEVPRVLLFCLIGFTCSIFAPLILPMLLIYFALSYLVYRNQFLNVYRTKYESGGQMWAVMHNSIIFSLVLTQIIALGVFMVKRSPVISSCTVPLLIFTLLFSEYCRNSFAPVFKSLAAQDLIDMDNRDEESGVMEQIHEHLLRAYSQSRKAATFRLTNDEALEEDDTDSDTDTESVQSSSISHKSTNSPERSTSPVSSFLSSSY